MSDKTMRHTMIISIRIRLSARMSKAPIPVGIATISAATMTRHAIPAWSLKPVKIWGAAKGRTTDWRISNSVAPRVLAARMKLGSTLRTPPAVV